MVPGDSLPSSRCWRAGFLLAAWGDYSP